MFEKKLPLFCALTHRLTHNFHSILSILLDTQCLQSAQVHLYPFFRSIFIFPFFYSSFEPFIWLRYRILIVTGSIDWVRHTQFFLFYISIYFHVTLTIRKWFTQTKTFLNNILCAMCIEYPWPVALLTHYFVRVLLPQITVHSSQEEHNEFVNCYNSVHTSGFQLIQPLTAIHQIDE